MDHPCSWFGNSLKSPDSRHMNLNPLLMCTFLTILVFKRLAAKVNVSKYTMPHINCTCEIEGLNRAGGLFKKFSSLDFWNSSMNYKACIPVSSPATLIEAAQQIITAAASTDEVKLRKGNHVGTGRCKCLSFEIYEVEKSIQNLYFLQIVTVQSQVRGACGISVRLHRPEFGARLSTSYLY